MSSDGKIVLSYHDALLRESDVNLVEGPYWLNDMVIAFWFEVLEKHLLTDYAKDIAFISPQVSQFLKLCGAPEAAIMLEPLGLPSKKLILFPVNDNEMEEMSGGTHWSLLTFSQSEGFLHYDSFKGSNVHQSLAMARAVGPHLGQDINLRPPREADCPSQDNGYDCGIHVICNAERICTDFIRNSCVNLKLSSEPRTKRKHILQVISSLAKNM